MDPVAVQMMFRFNTWANEHLRAAILGAGEERVRAPLEMWFGSVFKILAHIYQAEGIWLARLAGEADTPTVRDTDSVASVGALVEIWRDMDARWERYVGALSAADLARDVSVRRRDGSTTSYPIWQPLMQVAFHGTEHRGHATVALTQLGIAHGPQDFLLQFPRPASG